MPAGARQVVLVVVLIGGLAGCRSPSSARQPGLASANAETSSARARQQPQLVTSNVLRGDYAGSKECELCHPDVYKRWLASPMHRMTRRSGSAVIRAPFDGATFRLGGDSITMKEQDGAKLMYLASPRDGDHLYRITKVIGGRTREDFAGVNVTGATDPARARGHSPELVMPVSYVIFTGRWRYKGYSVQVPERPGLRAGPVWSKTCLGCHNTIPYLSTIYDDLLGPRREGYQGSVTDTLLPRSQLWTFGVKDAAGLDSALDDEIKFLGANAPADGASQSDLLLDALRATRRRMRTPELVEVGIGCESCHGGSREHSDDPSIMPTFEVRSPLIRRTPRSGTATGAAWLNRTCAHCHTVLFSGYPYTWEGGLRSDRVPGGSTVNSGEARNFLLGGCSSEMTCATCHDPHTRDSRERLNEMGTVAGNTTCLRCHGQYRTTAALRAHTHHDPGGAGSACVACHMPRKNIGLVYELTRYHRIGSPTDDNRVLRDRPLECALCHVDAQRGDGGRADGALVGTALRPRGAAPPVRQRPVGQRARQHPGEGQAARAGRGHRHPRRAQERQRRAGAGSAARASLPDRPLRRQARHRDDYRRAAADRPQPPGHRDRGRGDALAGQLAGHPPQRCYARRRMVGPGRP